MVEGWVGMVGSGKTFLLVKRIQKHIGKRRIFANDEQFKFAEHFKTWGELACIEDAIVIVDEIQNWAGSREWAKLPPEVGQYLSQSRKHGVDLLWTSQSVGSVDAVVRRLTSVVHRCQRWGPFIKENQFDAQSGEPLTHAWHRLDPRVYQLYDTYALIANSKGEGAGLGAARLKRSAEVAVAAWKARAVVPLPLPSGGWRRAGVLDFCGDGVVLLHGRPWRDYDRGSLMEIGRLGMVPQLVRWIGVVEVGLDPAKRELQDAA